MDERSDREVPPAWRRRLARAHHDLRSVWLERDDFPQALTLAARSFPNIPAAPVAPLLMSIILVLRHDHPSPREWPPR